MSRLFRTILLLGALGAVVSLPAILIPRRIGTTARQGVLAKGEGLGNLLARSVSDELEILAEFSEDDLDLDTQWLDYELAGIAADPDVVCVELLSSNGQTIASAGTRAHTVGPSALVHSMRFRVVSEGKAVGLVSLDMSLRRPSELEATHRVLWALVSLFLYAACVAIGWVLISLRSRNRELKTAQLAATVSVKAKEDFLSSMSHEIRTPLNGVLGMLEVVLDTKLDPDQREYCQIAMACGKHLLSIVNDILVFSRLGAGRLQIEVLRFRPRLVLEETVEILANAASSKGLVLRIRIDPDVPDWVRGGPAQLKQILLNFGSNAVKFAESGEIVLTAVPTPGDGIRFSVSDTGVGIPTDRLGAVFDEFTQADPTTTRVFGGSGLGLAICSRLSALMGGRVWAESEPGAGSTFFLEVPLPAEDAARRVTGSTRTLFAHATPLEAHRKILIADDNETNQKVASLLLQKRGHETVVVSNGAEAIRALQDAEFDLILMDFHMPVMDGLEASRQIRAGATRHIPIIAMTASVLEEDRDRCLSAGMDDYLAKPLRAKTLYAMVARWGGQTSTAVPKEEPRVLYP